MSEKWINELNDTACDYPRDSCVHELFEDRVKQSPNATAIVCGERSISYRELNGRANQLAHRLREMGVGRETLTGVLMSRSVEFVIAVIGILKAGGAYVPIDPDYPAQRQDFIVKDTCASIVVTDGAGVTNVPLDAEVIRLDQDTAAYPTTNLASQVEATNLAYVMYTSGSTGQPNGVEIPHRAIVRLLFGVKYVPLELGQTVAMLSPTSFDASTFEMWAPLLHGGTLVVSKQPFPTRHLIDRGGVTCLWLTSALFNIVVEQTPEVLASADYVLVGGEAVSVKYVRRAIELLPDTRIVAGYGPTESTTFASTFPIVRDFPAESLSVPIGRPIGNTRMYILDPQTRLSLPPGEPGELYIGGDGLARGYHNRPQLTRERFLPDPFDSRPGARMYKTGDRCSLLPDGNIDFLGRFDHQVKLHGHRIELGEIEAMLSMHPKVVQCAAAVEGEELSRRLVVYLTSAGSETPSTVELTDYLSERLPKFLVPLEFTILNTMPLGATGKINRRELSKHADLL